MEEENISVSVRVRPLSAREGEETFGWGSDGSSIWPLSRPNTCFTVDRVFGPATCTSEIYETDIRPLIEKAVVGINATFFAYGQTSSGKTYTIQGVEGDEGVVSLAVRDVFDLIKQHDTREFLCRASYLEIYNEEINDLLCGENTRLPLHEAKDGDVYVGGLTEEIVETAESVMNLLRTGEDNRHTGATRMNERSSRSHSIFRMIVESRSLSRESEENDDAIWVSTLNLVDLAGSERISKTGAEGLRMKEGTAINKSLLNLGIVINQLAHKSSVVSYRDSKLTRILQRSLGGNAKTAILCNITPAGCHVEESSNTLRFGCRAKKVINTAHVNEVLSDAALLKRQTKEIENLKKRLAESGNPDVEFEITQMRAALLRSEHEKELMQIKLDEEKAKKEKAERQVHVATQLMFKQEQELMLLEDKHKRRDTWCPGEMSQGSTSRPKGRADVLTSASKDVDCFTPPSAKRHMKAPQPSGLTPETSDVREPSNVTRMSTEDVRQLVRELVEEKAELQRKLAASSEGEKVKRSQIQSMGVDLRAAYEATRLSTKAIDGTENDREHDKLLVKMAALKLRNQELRMEQEISLSFLKKFVEKQKQRQSMKPDTMHTSSKEVAELKNALQKLQESEAAAKQSLLEKECECEDLKNQMDSRSTDTQQLRSAFDDSEEELKNVKMRHAALMEELEKQMCSVRRERDELEQQVFLKHEELSMTKKWKTKSETQASHIGKERDLHSREVDRLKKRLEEHEAKNKGLLRERVDLQSDKSALQRQVKALEKENTSLKNEALKKDNALDKKREVVQQELNKTKEKFEEVKEQQTSMQTSVTDLGHQLSIKTRDYEELRTQLDTSAKQMKQQQHHYEQQCTDLQLKLDERKSEATSMKTKFNSLTVVHSESLVQLESTKEQLVKANKAIERLETGLQVQKTEMRDDTDFRIDELSMQCELTAAENAELRRCLEEKEDAYLQIELALKTTKDEKKESENKAKDQQAHLEQRCKEISNQRATSEEAVQELRTQLTSKDSRLHELEQERTLLELMLTNARSEIEDLKDTSDQKTQQLTETHAAEIQGLRERCHALSQQLAATRDELSNTTTPPPQVQSVQDVQRIQIEEELLQLREKLKTAESEQRETAHRLGASLHEASEWKKMVNTTRNVEEWVKSLSEFIYELKFQSNQLLADFDDEENHIPTKIKTEACTQQRLGELTEKLRSAKRAEMELYGVLRVMKEDIKKAGWQPDKMDELLENSRKEYQRAYTEGKLQRVQAELKEKSTQVSRLEQELRSLKKQIPPKKLDIDLNRPPPPDLN